MDVCYEITEELADTTGVNQTDLPAIYDVVDPDVIHSIVDSSSDDVAIVFDYCDHQITVFASGYVEIDQLYRPVRSWEVSQQ